MNNKNDRNSTNRYMTNGPRKSFGPNGCQATTNNKDTKCGETKTLQIIQEFKKLYENKMKEIDAEAGGDCVQAKINLQQDWIRDLTEQNEMLVKAVEELEVEAADRVNMLEEKLKKNSKCACEVMECYRDFSINLLEDLQKMERTQNDLNNLIELIRRARNDGVWSTDGLQFYNLDVNELLGHRHITNDETTLDLRKTDVTDYKLQKALKEKENKIKELEERLQAGLGAESDKQLEELKKSMLDMRDALTAEVAHKHDTIVSLRRDVHVLEEQCRKADQQTHFKDDIIKELRKEIRQIKTQTKSQTRSPRTMKKDQSRSSPIHCSQTVPNTALDNLKDGVIVIKDTATVGDNITTQNIKEKYSDPTNQTIIYICEGENNKNRSKKRNSKESSPQIKYMQTSHNSDHTYHLSEPRNVKPTKFDHSNFGSFRLNFETPHNSANAGLSRSYDEGRNRDDRNHEVSRSLDSTRYHMDYPRDSSVNIEDLESSFDFKDCDSTTHNIRETCAQYSKDIIKMLNRNALEQSLDLQNEECPTNCDASDCDTCEKLIQQVERTLNRDFCTKIKAVRKKIDNQCLDLTKKKNCNEKKTPKNIKYCCGKNLQKYHNLDTNKCCHGKRDEIIVNHFCTKCMGHDKSERKVEKCNECNNFCLNVDENPCECHLSFKDLDDCPNKCVDLRHLNTEKLNDSDQQEPTLEDSKESDGNNKKEETCGERCDCSKIKIGNTPIKQEISNTFVLPSSDVDLKWYKLMQEFCGENEARNAKFSCPVIYKDFVAEENSNETIYSTSEQHKNENSLISQIKEFVPNLLQSYFEQNERKFSNHRLTNGTTSKLDGNDVIPFEANFKLQNTSKEENLSADSLEISNRDCTKSIDESFQSIKDNLSTVANMDVSLINNGESEENSGKIVNEDFSSRKYENREIQTEQNSFQNVIYVTKSSQTCPLFKNESCPKKVDSACIKILDRHPKINTQIVDGQDVSFNEGEISGFSTPCRRKVDDRMKDIYKVQCHRKGDSKYYPHEDRERKVNFRKNCEAGEFVSSPRSSWRSHHNEHATREPKLLSHRTLLHGTKKQNRPMSSRSESFPPCAKNLEHDYIPGCHYVDMRFLMNEHNVRNYYGTDGRKYVNVLELSEADRKVLMRTSEGLKNKQLMYEFSGRNNTF